MRLSRAILFISLLTVLPALARQAPQAAPADAVLRRFALGGAGGWDDLSIDPARHRLYLSRGDRVVVVDTSSGQAVGEVPGTNGIHGIALAPGRHVGFTSNGRDDAVTVFDLESLKAVATIKVTGSNPDAILYDPASAKVFVFNGRSANATVIDAATRKVAGTIALDGKPEFARADGRGHVYVNIEDKGEIAQIDAATLKVLATWKLPGCEEPSGLALDDAHRRLFSACDNGKMAVTDADSGRHVADIPVGAGPDGAAYDPARGMVFSPNGHDGTLTIARQEDADHYRVVATVPTRTSARTMVLDEVAHKAYLPAAEFDPLPANAPPHTRPPLKPGSFEVLEVGEKPAIE